MARLARVEVFAADEIAVVHVMARTVRRCFLLGEDALTGKNYDHRKLWKQLSDSEDKVCEGGSDDRCASGSALRHRFAVSGDPVESHSPGLEISAEWGDSEVARRWLMLCPVRRDKNRQRIEPTEFELNHICHDKEKVAVVRNRLSDISRWMRSQVQDDAVVLSSQSARHLSPVDLSGRDVKSGRGGERGHAVITKGTVAATKVFCRCRLPII